MFLYRTRIVGTDWFVPLPFFGLHPLHAKLPERAQVPQSISANRLTQQQLMHLCTVSGFSVSGKEKMGLPDTSCQTTQAGTLEDAQGLWLPIVKHVVSDDTDMSKVKCWIHLRDLLNQTYYMAQFSMVTNCISLLLTWHEYYNNCYYYCYYYYYFSGRPLGTIVCWHPE